MPIARLTAAASILALASASHAQDLMLFPPETFGQVVAPRNESMLGDVQLEVSMGSYNNEFISNYGSNSIFARTGRSVGMLQILTNVGHAPCTGFLVEGNKIVTNHHCVPGVLKHPQMKAQGANSIAAVQFHVGFVRDGLDDGVKTFHVNPVPLETSEALDYTVLQVLGDANADFGALELTAAVPQDRDPFWVIGHPMGEAQRISREKCQADSPAIAKQRLRHTCDTLPGNSGSPVIDAGSQKVIGLHHAGSRAGDVNFAVPMAEILAQSKVLTAVVPVAPDPVEPDSGELDAAFALSDALTLEDRVERIAALEALVRDFGTTRAATRAERKLNADRKQLQDDAERLNEERLARLARNKAAAEEERQDDAMAAYRSAIRQEDLADRIALLATLQTDFAGTVAAGLAADGEKAARRLQAQLAALSQPQPPTPAVRATAYGIDASAWLSGTPGAAGSVFRECKNCPEMVVIPAGEYMQGSPKDELGRHDDEAQRRVRIPAPLAVGRFEVTFAQWDACAADGYCRKDVGDEGWGRGTRPVINVSWDDTQAFLRWMNSQVDGSPYRLPSEAEWEYAARAGTTTPFWTGSTISTAQANYNGNSVYGDGSKGEYREKTLPVGSFDANPFGLFDVHGNVWDRVEHCYAESYNELLKDVRSNTTSGCGHRVLRGGSWNFHPKYLRSAFRFGLGPNLRYRNVGFRLARTLTP